MIKLGSSDMAKAYVGSSEISKMYLGNDLVYENTPPPYDSKIEYIETDGSAFIDTGIKGSSTVTFDINIYIPNHTDKLFWVFGSRNASNSGQLAFFNNNINNNHRWFYGNSNSTGTGFLQSGLYNFKNTETKNVLKINSSKSLTISNSTFTGNYNFYLLTLNSNGAAVTGNMAAGARIINAKMYINNTLVRDFIPVRIDTTGYLYDKVSNQLFGNANQSGAFILGSDI